MKISLWLDHCSLAITNMAFSEELDKAKTERAFVVRYKGCTLSDYLTWAYLSFMLSIKMRFCIVRDEICVVRTRLGYTSVSNVSALLFTWLIKEVVEETCPALQNEALRRFLASVPQKPHSSQELFFLQKPLEVEVIVFLFKSFLSGVTSPVHALFLLFVESP